MNSDEKLQKTVQDIWGIADIKINRNRPWDIQVHNSKFYSRVLAKGSLGLGESYMDGWWDCKSLDQFFDRVLSNELQKKVRPISVMFDILKAKIINLQNKKRSKTRITTHLTLRISNLFFIHRPIITII